MSGQHLDTRGFERSLRQRGYLVILAAQHALRHLDLRDPRPEPRQRLRQLAADRAAAEHGNAGRGTLHLRKRVPHGVAGQIIALLQPGDGRHEGLGPRRDHDAARCEPLRHAILARDLYRPGINHFAVAFDNIDTQAGVALDAVMRFDGADRLHDPLDRLAEGYVGFGWRDAIAIRMAHLFGDLGALDQRLGGHATGIEAVAAHLVRFDQRHLGLHRRRNQR